MSMCQLLLTLKGFLSLISPSLFCFIHYLYIYLVVCFLGSIRSEFFFLYICYWFMRWNFVCVINLDELLLCKLEIIDFWNFVFFLFFFKSSNEIEVNHLLKLKKDSSFLFYYILSLIWYGLWKRSWVFIFHALLP